MGFQLKHSKFFMIPIFFSLFISIGISAQSLTHSLIQPLSKTSPQAQQHFQDSNQCEVLFEKRADGLNAAQIALSCYQSQLATSLNRLEKSNVLNKISYLKFFIAEYFLDDKPATLLEGINLAEASILLFGEKYSLASYRLLSSAELKLLATALYNYGLLTARYIDLMGVTESLMRMNDIKKSMLTIIRLKEDDTAIYGAYRTMGIFHTKVPAIAGGDMSLAKEFLEKALKLSEFKDGLSRYPANNVAYADWLYKSGLKTESCLQLKLVKDLNEATVRSMDNGLFFESLIDIQKSTQLYIARKCTN